MFDNKVFEGMAVEDKYKNMLLMVRGFLEDDVCNLTKICNVIAVINALVDRINWCGFYFKKGEELYLGPFQGMPACTSIKIGKGVCGTSVETGETILVHDVNKFKGHIACDAASNSEIVIPIIKDDIVYGVLDIDSSEIGRFNNIDKVFLEECVQLMNGSIIWEKIIKNYE